MHMCNGMNSYTSGLDDGLLQLYGRNRGVIFDSFQTVDLTKDYQIRKKTKKQNTQTKENHQKNKTINANKYEVS